ncbi:hypothetical protein ACN24K_30465 [Streptomyces microflavus]
MIRAGRGHLVRTLVDLAAQQGVSSQRYRKLKPYEAAGFPERISSARARTRLYDGEQVDAYLLGKPVPSLPERDDDNDLLDRQECAAELGVSPRSWDAYKNDPLLTGHMAKVGGVEHWPRGIVHEFRNSRPGKVLNRQDRTTTAAAPPSATPSTALSPRTSRPSPPSSGANGMGGAPPPPAVIPHQRRGPPARWRRHPVPHHRHHTPPDALITARTT